MTSPNQRNRAPRKKPKNDGDIPLWQLVIGGLFIAVGGLYAGVMISEMALSIWMPGVLR